jgi:hypothetical protein
MQVLVKLSWLTPVQPQLRLLQTENLQQQGAKPDTFDTIHICF